MRVLERGPDAVAHSTNEVTGEQQVKPETVHTSLTMQVTGVAMAVALARRNACAAWSWPL